MAGIHLLLLLILLLRTCVEAKMCCTFLFQLMYVISGAAAAPGAPVVGPCT
jgi:hypothetical protein